MITIWHNPRCSKSRQTLDLMRSHGIEPRIVDYLKTPPDAAEIERVLAMLGISARHLLRRNEAAYRSERLDRPLSEKQLVKAMARHPILIERPIVITGKGAAIGRPPEAVLGLL